MTIFLKYENHNMVFDSSLKREILLIVKVRMILQW